VEEKSEWTLNWSLQQLSALGITPVEVYAMTIAEANLFIVSRNNRNLETITSLAWRTINFLGALFSGKLEPLDRYMPSTPEREEELEDKKENMMSGLADLGFKKG
jgi:hypothetical protein